MSRKDDCWDNAVAESFFASFKKDLIYRRSWGTKASVQEAVKEWIEVFYNCQRRHSSLGNVSPVNYEHYSSGSSSVTNGSTKSGEVHPSLPGA